MTTAHSFRTTHRPPRVLACDRCGAAVEAPMTGGDLACHACHALRVVPARPDTSIPCSPDNGDAARLETLQSQDADAPGPPAGLEHLAEEGFLRPYELDEARQIWGQTRPQLEELPGDVAAAQRLVWLVRLFSETASIGEVELSVRGYAEAALEVVTLSRHRQYLRCLLARHVLLRGDQAEAEAWLAGCDPWPAELSMDSEFRLSSAMLATARGEFDDVLDILGAQGSRVPVLSTYEPLAVVLRANAYEGHGDVARAAEVLADLPGGAGGKTLSRLVGALPEEWNVCARSPRHARRLAKNERARRSSSRLGFYLLGGLLIALPGIPFCLLIAYTATSGLPHPGTVAVVVILQLVLGTLGIRAVLQARRLAWVAKEGLSGTAVVLSVETTGKKFNGVSQLVVRLRVSVPGYPERDVVIKHGAPPHKLEALVGGAVDCLWSPRFPDDVVAHL